MRGDDDVARGRLAIEHEICDHKITTSQFVTSCHQSCLIKWTLRDVGQSAQELNILLPRIYPNDCIDRLVAVTHGNCVCFSFFRIN